MSKYTVRGSRDEGTCDSTGLLPISVGHADQLHADELCGAYEALQSRCDQPVSARRTDHPRLVGDKVCGQVVPTPPGYVVLDDTGLDKNYSSAMELVRRQYRGTANAVSKGSGVVTWVYGNPETEHFWGNCQN